MPTPPPMTIDPDAIHRVAIATDRGDIVMRSVGITEQPRA